jgi:hypothetical protein
MKAITQKLKDKEPMVGNLGRNFVRDGVVLLMDWSVLDRSRVELHQPYIDAEGRVLCLQEGSAKYLVNMKELELRPNQVLVIPENSLVELEEIGDGFAVQGFSFHRLPMASLFTQGTVVTPDDASWQRLGNACITEARTPRLPCEAQDAHALHSPPCPLRSSRSGLQATP